MDGSNETLNIQTSMFNHKLVAVLKTVLKTVLLNTNFLDKNYFYCIISELIERAVFNKKVKSGERQYKDNKLIHQASSCSKNCSS